MATGLKIPMVVDDRGGLATVSADEHSTQLIRLALSDDDNENAFQQSETIGLGTAMIFQPADAKTRAAILRRLYNLFKTFESDKKFTLLRDTIKWDKSKAEQALVLSFDYVDLESDETRNFTTAYRLGA